MGFSKNTQATRSTLMSVDSTLSEAITASQDYIPIASTTNFSTSVVAEIETTNEVVSFTDISVNDQIYSQDLTQSNWTKVRATIIANDGTAPDGTVTADLLSTNTSSGSKVVYDSAIITPTADSVWACSWFVKDGGSAASEPKAMIEVGSGANNGKASINLTTGAVSSVSANNNVSDCTASTTSVGDGWYRVEMIVTFGGSWTGNANFAMYDNDNGTTGTTVGILLWGAQLEEAGAPTTYLPTTTAALVGLTDVTRGVNGTTAALATSGDAIQQLPYALSEINMPTRLRGISVSSDGTGVGRFTLCDKIGTTLCDIDIPDTRIYDLSFGGGIIFPNGIYVSNSDNITAYTLFTDKHSGAGL